MLPRTPYFVSFFAGALFVACILRGASNEVALSSSLPSQVLSSTPSSPIFLPSPPTVTSSTSLRGEQRVLEQPQPSKSLQSMGVGGFKDPSTWCTSNPFLATWKAPAFEAATASVLEYRSSIVERTHEKTWKAHMPDKEGKVNHKPYDSLPSVVPCLDEVYNDADGKFVCGMSRLTPPCVIYSLGSDGNFGFEESVSKSTPCEIHTFDCTVSAERLPSTLPPRVTFHPICLGSDEVSTSKYRSLGSLMREFGHTRVDLLKMDIEGFEFRVVEALYGSFLKEGGKNLPLQIAFEQHYLTGGSPQPAWANQNPGLSAGDMAILWVDLTDMGYVLVGRQDQWACPYCTELAAMRAFC